MIRFTTTCLVRSMRWVAPFLVFASWTAVVLAANGTALVKASSIFPAVLIWSTWITIVTGNHDDDAHRDLVAAAIGGASSVHILRAVTVAVVSVVPVVVVAILARISALQPGHPAGAVVAATAGFEASAAAIGIAIGVWLHRPILRHRGVSTLTASAACIGVMLFAPVESVHRSLSDDRIGSIGPMLAICSLVAVISVAASARIAQRRA